MATRRTPSIVVLTEEDLKAFMLTVQEGFQALSDRLDTIEEKLANPGLPTARLRKDIAAAALKAATSRPAPRKVVK